MDGGEERKEEEDSKQGKEEGDKDGNMKRKPVVGEICIMEIQEFLMEYLQGFYLHKKEI